MTQEASQCSFAASLNCKDKSAEKALATSSNSSISKSSHSEDDDVSPSCHHPPTSSVQTSENPKIKSTEQRKGEKSQQLPPSRTNGAKRTPSNVSSKKVTFCLKYKYEYAWYPPAVDSDLVDSYFKEVPQAKIPKVGTLGEKYRDIQLFYQIPRQDLLPQNCLYLDKRHWPLFQSMVQERNEKALDVATIQYVFDVDSTCKQCGKKFYRDNSKVFNDQSGEGKDLQDKCNASATGEYGNDSQKPVAVVASLVPPDADSVSATAPDNQEQQQEQQPEQLGDREEVIPLDRITSTLTTTANGGGNFHLWHPCCFICSVCKELLVDLIYCRKEEKLYCLRHYSQTLWPRCPACDELVLDESRTKAMDSEWHEKHFSCWQCDENLTAKKYVLRDDKSYCIKCFESNFSSTCDACKKVIGIDSKDLAYKDKHWHEACFLCAQCSISLVDKNFGSKSDKLYCSNCYDIQFSTKCEGCGDIFRSGSKKVEYKGQVFHDQCFTCVGCKAPIGSKSFVPKGTETYCTECYEAKFANRCIKCGNSITGNGLSFRDDNWHKECFTCINCNTQLFGNKFTTKNDKPYCAECHNNLFAKKCTRCTKGIIPGGSGSRFISFEDRNWHNDCFLCSGCTTSLIGRGFIPDGPDILCSDCARQRLA